MKKTLSFATLHFFVAFSVAYILTGDIILGSLIALVEPSVNTAAFYFHEKIWQSVSIRQRNPKPQLKTTSFALVHFSVAFCVVYLLTGDIFAGGIVALIEPCINTSIYYFHEKVWQKRLSDNYACHA